MWDLGVSEKFEQQRTSRESRCHDEATCERLLAAVELDCLFSQLVRASGWGANDSRREHIELHSIGGARDITFRVRHCCDSRFSVQSNWRFYRTVRAVWGVWGISSTSRWSHWLLLHHTDSLSHCFSETFSVKSNGTPRIVRIPMRLKWVIWTDSSISNGFAWNKLLMLICLDRFER